MQEPDQQQVRTRLPWRGPQPLRRRVLAAILLVTIAATLVFAAPLAYAVREIYRGAQLTALQRDAVSLATTLPDSPPSGAAFQRPSWLPLGVSAGLYRSGARMSGSGPAFSTVARQARDGRSHAALSGGVFAAAAPVQPDEATGFAVVVSASDHEVLERTLRAWLLMAALAIGVWVAAAVVARALARRLVRPWENLAAAARALGAGDFAIRATTSGIREADDASLALEQTAGRLGQVRERERLFARDVSHQLRTPLAGLMVTLEGALSRPDGDLRRAVARGLERARSLESTIDDLLELTRPVQDAAMTDIGQVVEETVARRAPQFAERGRALRARSSPGIAPAAASAATVRQVLDVLLDNALLHGSGEVLAAAREVPGGVALDVEDEGPGMPPENELREGIGLPLARTLSAAAGGRLLLVRAGPHPLFRLLLPQYHEEPAAGLAGSKR